jgi:hypothetical protein
MSKPLLILFFCFVHIYLHGQANSPDPLKDIDPANRSNTSESAVARQALPRTEIPGTLRQTQQDENAQSIFIDPALARHNASDTVSSIFVVPSEHLKVRDTTYVQPYYQQKKSADTLDYLPVFREDTVSRDSTLMQKP